MAKVFKDLQAPSNLGGVDSIKFHNGQNVYDVTNSSAVMSWRTEFEVIRMTLTVQFVSLSLF